MGGVGGDRPSGHISGELSPETLPREVIFRDRHTPHLTSPRLLDLKGESIRRKPQVQLGPLPAFGMIVYGHCVASNLTSSRCRLFRLLGAAQETQPRTPTFDHRVVQVPALQPPPYSSCLCRPPPNEVSLSCVQTTRALSSPPQGKRSGTEAVLEPNPINRRRGA